MKLSKESDVWEPLVDKDIAESKAEQPWMVYLTTFVAVCGSFAFGSCTGYSSPAQAGIRNDLSLSIAEFSLFGSLLTFGAMIGAITCGPIADFIGRKGAMRVSSAFCVVGWLAIFFAKGVVPLDLGRLATGYGLGAFSYVVPIFVAEIAPKTLRGALTTLNQIMICVGGSVSFIIGTLVTWRVLALIGFPARHGMIIYAIIQVVVTALNAPIVDRAGRKPLLLVSATGLVIGCLITAVSFYLKAHDMAHEAVPILAVVGVMVYTGAFAAGMGAMPWVVMSEIFPINIKGVGGGMATLVNWFGAWAVSYTFNFLMSWSSYGTFIIYAVVNALAIVFVIAVVPCRSVHDVAL